MTYHKYQKKLNGTEQRCTKCGIAGEMNQHHIGKRRYSELCIFLCTPCHNYVHANTKESYEKGFLVKKGIELERLNNSFK